MSALLGGCCCGVDVECPPSSCAAGLASTYLIDLQLAYTYTGVGITYGNSCGNDGSNLMTLSGLLVSEVSGNCECQGERQPPFIGPRAYLGKGWQVANSPSPNLLVSETAGGACLYPCGNVSQTSVPGTFTANAGGQGYGSATCGTGSALTIVNEVNEDTGLDVWYWVLGLSFRSTATVACFNPSQPVWQVLLSLASEPRPECHPPIGLTWTGEPDPTDGTYFRDRWRGRMGIANGVTLVPGNGCVCWNPTSVTYAFGTYTETTCNVGIS